MILCAEFGGSSGALGAAPFRYSAITFAPEKRYTVVVPPETFPGNLANLLDGRQNTLQPFPSQQVRFMWRDDLRCSEIRLNVGGVPTKVPTVECNTERADYLLLAGTRAHGSSE